MEIVETFEDLPKTDGNLTRFCAVYRPTIWGRFVVHKRGIYLTIYGSSWSLAYDDKSQEWANECWVWNATKVSFTHK